MRPLITLLTAAALCLLAACSTSPLGDDDTGTGKSYEWARDRAEPVARYWSADALEAGFVGLWVDSRGELVSGEGSPMWVFAYVAEDNEDTLAVVVTFEGQAAPIPLEEDDVDPEPLNRSYTDEDVLRWMIVAYETMRDHPYPLDDYDHVLGVFHDGEYYRRDLAAVGFFEEGSRDESFDPEEFDILGLMMKAHAFLIIDPDSDEVLLKSWF